MSESASDIPFPPLHGLHEAFDAWARATSHGLSIGGGGADYVDHIELTHRRDPRDPEEQLLLRADLVDGKPVIRVTTRSTSERRALKDGDSMSVLIRVDEEAFASRGRDPHATCESCGALGTIGHASRRDGESVVTETHKFCVVCWPEQSARYRARWEDEDRRRRDDFFRGRDRRTGAWPSMYFRSATWHATLDLVRQLERSMAATVPPSADTLTQLAEQIRQSAPHLEGEMPTEIEHFLHRYGERTT